MSVESVLPQLLQPAFFAGQRLLPDDLTIGQQYHREMRRLHNRSLHSWGIALGLIVRGDDEAKQVVVEPGFALDSLGRELVLAESLTVPVPPIAGDANGEPVPYYLTISYVDDAEARPAQNRKGVCSGEGAVRLAEQPLVRWQPVFGTDDAGYRPGLDVVLASAQVLECRLDGPISLVQRRDARAETQPYVAGGATPAGDTFWEQWFPEDNPNPGQELGLEVAVDTSSGRFKSTPHYLAQLAGARGHPVLSNVFYEGFVQVDAPKPDQFVLRMLMPAYAFGEWRLNPRSEPSFDEMLLVFRQEMAWHVVWTGIEG